MSYFTFTAATDCWWIWLVSLFEAKSPLRSKQRKQDKRRSCRSEAKVYSCERTQDLWIPQQNLESHDTGGRKFCLFLDLSCTFIVLVYCLQKKHNTKKVAYLRTLNTIYYALGNEMLYGSVSQMKGCWLIIWVTNNTAPDFLKWGGAIISSVIQSAVQSSLSVWNL